VGIAAMAFLSPRTDLVAIAWLALFVAFASASQDIVVDAYRTDVASREQRGLAARSASWAIAWRCSHRARSRLVLVAGSGWIPALGGATPIAYGGAHGDRIVAVFWARSPRPPRLRPGLCAMR